MIEKTIDIKAKTNLQLLFETKKLNSRCSESYKLLAKKKKDKVSQKHQDGDKNKAKSYNLLFANMSQS